jgi:hypothetical protein
MTGQSFRRHVTTGLITVSALTLAAMLYLDYRLFVGAYDASSSTPVDPSRLIVVQAKPEPHGEYWFIRAVVDNQSGTFVHRFELSVTARDCDKPKCVFVSRQVGNGYFQPHVYNGGRAGMVFLAPNNREYAWSYQVTAAWAN